MEAVGDALPLLGLPLLLLGGLALHARRVLGALPGPGLLLLMAIGFLLLALRADAKGPADLLED